MTAPPPPGAPGASDRRADRVIVVAAIGLAFGFLVAASLSLLLDPGVRRGAWLPIHLALAGAASTAIAGLAPFFAAALAAGPPAGRRLRATGVLAVALGAAGVCGAMAADAMALAATGGAVYLGGALLVTLATIRSASGGPGTGRGLVARAYVIALAYVTVGAALATLSLAGWPPVADAWGRLVPAHAWLNLVGFVSLVIAATLLHLLPTVVGARIAHRALARTTVVAIGVGAPTVALGLAWPWDAVARGGAALVTLGAGALAVHALLSWRARARWTSDHAWHRFASLGLLCAVGWFVVGMGIDAGMVLIVGAVPGAATPRALLGPLVAGWVGLALAASATHLLPAVGPGDARAHGRQRQVLGRASGPRLVAANAGIAILTAGLAGSWDALAVTGGLLVAGSLALTAALAALALRIALSGGLAGSTTTPRSTG